MERLKDFFDLTKQEQRGVISLLILLVTLLVARVTLSFCITSPPDSQLAKLRAEIEAQIEMNKSLPDEEFRDEYSSSPKPARKFAVDLFYFDPNSASIEELSKLGFKEWQIKNFINFRKSGGKFFEKKDLKKLFSIKEKDYEKYSPYIRISPLQAQDSPIAVPAQHNDSRTIIELNQCDTNDLKALKGVGGYFARKIIERRQKLGGFNSLEQLSEVYRLDPMVLEWNRSRLRVDVTRVNRININTASIDQLKGHPYIGYKIASVIVKYREQHGRYTAIKEISNSVLITDSVYSKIAPYLKVDD